MKKEAGKLKGAYLSGIADTLGAEAMAEAGAMENAKLAGKLGMDMGDQASVVMSPSRTMFYDDGDPTIYAAPNLLAPVYQYKQVGTHPAAANPGGLGENLPSSFSGYGLKKVPWQFDDFDRTVQDNSPRGMMRRQQIFDRAFPGGHPQTGMRINVL